MGHHGWKSQPSSIHDSLTEAIEGEWVEGSDVDAVLDFDGDGDDLDEESLEIEYDDTDD